MLTRRDLLRNSGLASIYLTLGMMPEGLLHERQQPSLGELLLESAAWSEQTPAGRDEPAAIVHLLNRITFGAQPGDVQRVQRQGYDAFLEEQLHPEAIDDSAFAPRLAKFKALGMSSANLYAAFVSKSASPPTLITAELQGATLLRALFSKRQLFEVMVDFWSNHFNIELKKKRGRWLKVADDRDVIRCYALGKFRDLLLASARSPAMLVSLDNNENKAPDPLGKRAGGINENYAREVMELHTVGVNGGYTQADIQAVARTLTGWGVVPPKEANALEFRFRADWHDNQPKEIPFLDLSLPANGGLEEGDRLLAALALHPKTAERIAYKLAVTFVADDPPPALVARAAQTYLETDTDIRATLATILRADEFRAAASQKIKLPLRLLVSAARTVAADVANESALLDALRRLGQPLFGWSAPNGYPQIGAAWVNTGAMLARWNLAFALVKSEIEGVAINLNQFMPDSSATVGALVDALGQTLFHAPLPPPMRGLLVDYASESRGENDPLDHKRLERLLPEVAGLLLASPAFQIH